MPMSAGSAEDPVPDLKPIEGKPPGLLGVDEEPVATAVYAPRVVVHEAGRGVRA